MNINIKKVIGAAMLIALVWGVAFIGFIDAEGWQWAAIKATISFCGALALIAWVAVALFLTTRNER